MRDRQKLEEYRENVRFDGQMRQKIQNLLADNVSRTSTEKNRFGIISPFLLSKQSFRLPSLKFKKDVAFIFIK